MSGMWLSICTASKVCMSGRNNAYASAAGEVLAGGAPARELGIPSLHIASSKFLPICPNLILSLLQDDSLKETHPCEKPAVCAASSFTVAAAVAPPSHDSGQDDEQELEHEQRTRRAFRTKRTRLLVKKGIIHAHTVETPAPEHLDKNLCKH